jgi:hypothetical protein
MWSTSPISPFVCSERPDLRRSIRKPARSRCRPRLVRFVGWGLFFQAHVDNDSPAGLCGGLRVVGGECAGVTRRRMVSRRNEFAPSAPSCRDPGRHERQRLAAAVLHRSAHQRDQRRSSPLSGQGWRSPGDKWQGLFGVPAQSRPPHALRSPHKGQPGLPRRAYCGRPLAGPSDCQTGRV